MTPDIRKFAPADLAAFGGTALYATPISTSNLVRPDIDKFLAYSRVFHDAHRYTNDGPLVKMLESRLAAFHGTRHCIATANGFWALVLSIKALALPGRHEVVMPSLTYRRLADIVAWCGLVPRFVEVDPDTLAMTAALTEVGVGADTALILGVHPIVNCCDAAGLERLAREHGVPLVFDAVESVFETVGGRKVGSFGAAECFSAHASKLLNGFEGGYVTTDDDALAHQLAKMRGFGYFGQDNIENLGINAKLNEIHAAMALASLDDLDDQVVRNRARYRAYQRELAGLDGVRLLAFDESERCSFKTIVVELTGAWPLTRDATVELLNREGILARAYYSPALHQKPTRYETRSGPLPVTERLAQRYLLLPCGHFVSDADIAAVVALLRFVHEHAPSIQESLAA
ncbi:MAG: aminotransferase class I/II-fold pyridoxal phosphate-dependent enzyme [Pseudomonadota bacterium]|nr:aminotransferase class I/II-fold pyridoxal phosphate-dependent enzyme [Pseudomonadota bacterium]